MKKNAFLFFVIDVPFIMVYPSCKGQVPKKIVKNVVPQLKAIVNSEIALQELPKKRRTKPF